MAKVIPAGENVMQVVAVPVVQPADYQYRKVLSRKDANSVAILHEIPQTKFVDGCVQKTGKMFCPCLFWSCSCCDPCSEAKKAAKESEYTWVMENRLEFNRPALMPKMECCALCLCQCRVYDMPTIWYYDSEIFDHVTTDNPPCYHLKTWCCGSAGETIAFRSRFLCCPSVKSCGVTMATLTVTEGTADKTAAIINEARDNARAKMSKA